MKFRLQPVLGALVIILLIFISAFQFKEWALQGRQKQEQIDAENRLRQVAAALTHSINQRLQLTSSLAAFVTMNQNFTQPQFERFATLLQQNMIGIRSLQLAPDGIVQYLTNFDDNRAAFGHNLLKDDRLSEFINQSVNERRYVIQGPYELLQGGLGIIARRPLYFEQADPPNNDFWGFAAVVIELQPILESAGFFEFEKEMVSAIRRKDGLGQEGDVFYGSASTFASPLAFATVKLPDASWQLAAANHTDHTHHGVLDSPWYWVFSFLSASLLAVIGYSIIDRPHQLRKQIQNATESLRTTLNSIGDAVIATDVSGSITLMNPIAEKLTGWTLEQAKDRPLSEIFRVAHVSTGEPIADPVEKALTSDHSYSIDSDSLLISRNGTKYRIADSAAPIHEKTGYATGVVLVFRDVTEDHAAQAALLESENQFRRLFETADVSIWNEDLSEVCSSLEQLRDQGITNLRKYLEENPKSAWEIAAKIKVIRVNEATLKLFGVKGENDFLFNVDKFFGPGAIETFIDSLCAIWDKKRAFRQEANFQTLDGKPLRGIVSYQIPDNFEDCKSVPVSILDITERVQTEHALNRAQKMEAVGLLTGGIAHEFNNILGIILGNVDLLQPSVANDEKGINRLEHIKQSAERAADLTRKLLGFARQKPAQLHVTDINQVNRVMGNLIARSVTPEITVKQYLAENLWHTEIDSGDFEGVLLNLALNARDAMPNGGDLILETHNCLLDDEYCSNKPDLPPGEYVQLIVRDNGDGISQENIERIFEPFFTTKRQGEGTGLGLALVFAFAKRSGGHIEVCSEPGIGTSFKLYLPRTNKTDKRSNQANKQLQTHPRAHETILVVDDEPLLVELAQKYLQLLGYRVLTAGNGKHALDILAAEPKIDLLFSDVVMPGGMTGDELAARATHNNRKLKVLLTSGYSEKVDLNKNKALLSKNILGKPYTQSDLAKRIRSLLDD